MRKIEMIGETFGRLTVLNRAEAKHGQIYYNCVCECGKQVIVRGDSLRSGKTQSCGCKLEEAKEGFGDRVKKSIIAYGKEYSIVEFCKEFKFPTSTFYRHFKKYKSPEDFIENFYKDREEAKKKKEKPVENKE